MLAIILGMIPAIIIRWFLFKKNLPIAVALLISVLVLSILAYVSHSTGVISTRIAGAIGAVTFIILIIKRNEPSITNSDNDKQKESSQKIKPQHSSNSFIDFIELYPQKVKALYIVWVVLQTIIFLTSGNFISRYRSDFYPFSGLRISISDYDYSEFIIYSIVPLAIYYFIKLWRGKN